MKTLATSIILAPLAFAIATSPVQANNKAGKVILSKGEVSAELEGQERKLRRGRPIYEGDTVTTGPSAMLQMNMQDNGLISLSENSVFTVERYNSVPNSDDSSVLLNMVEGGFRAVTGSIGKKNPAAVKVRTTVASIGIRGTGYEVFQYDGSLYVSMLSGNVELSNSAGQLLLGDDAEYSFARVDSDNSLPQGLYSLPADVAANNPFFASTEVPAKKLIYRVPLEELALNAYPINTFTSINSSENSNNLKFTAMDPTDDKSSDEDTSDNDTGGSEGGDSSQSPSDGIGGNNTSLTLAELTAEGSSAHVLLPSINQPVTLTTRLNSDGDIVLLMSPYATETNYEQLIRPGTSSPAAGYPLTTGFDSKTTWGVWLANATTPAVQYSMSDGQLSQTNIEDTIFWLSTTPATKLNGSFTFLSTGTYIGTSTEGDVDQLTASMRVNFDSAKVSNGFLNVSSGNYQWATLFEGELAMGENGELGGDFSLAGDNINNGLLSGYFVESDEIFFTGAFSINDSDDASARGLLAMEGYQTITVYGGDGTNLNQYGTLVAFEGSALLHGPTSQSPQTTTRLGYNSTDADGTLAGWFVELDQAANMSGYPAAKTSLGSNTYWGVWNASQDSSANLRYRTRDNEEYNSPIESTVYWMSTESVALTRTGSASYVSTGDFIGSSNSGTVTSLEATLGFDFDSAALTSGQLNLVAGGDAWEFSVENASSTELNMDHGYFSIRQTQVNADTSNGVFGAIEGYFVGSDAASISAAFGLFRQGDSNYLDSVNGLFSMQESR